MTDAVENQYIEMAYARVSSKNQTFTFMDVLATVIPPYFANGAPMRVSSSRASSSVLALSLIHI